MKFDIVEKTRLILLPIDELLYKIDSVMMELV